MKMTSLAGMAQKRPFIRERLTAHERLAHWRPVPGTEEPGGVITMENDKGERMTGRWITPKEEVSP
jgi:hypothetical protein